MKSKSNTRALVQSFFKMIDTQFNTKIKIFHTNNGLELAMHDFYAFQGVIHQTSCVKTPQRNSILTQASTWQHPVEYC